MYRSTMKAIIYAVTVVLLIAGIAPAASAEPSTSAVGNLTLESQSSTSSVSYTTCAVIIPMDGTFTRFRNNPLPGCAVRLINPLTRKSARLCTGAWTIPPEVRESPVVRIEPGTSVPCPDVGTLQA
jgi:hypothetical protein